MSYDAERAYAEIEAMLSANLPKGNKREKLLTFHKDKKKLFLKRPASLNHHHCYDGGYAIHVCEVMRNCLEIYESVVESLPDINFGVQDLVISAYVHDLDKLLLRYVDSFEPPSEDQKKYARALGLKVAAKDSKKILVEKIAAAKAGREPDLSGIGTHSYNSEFLPIDDGAIVLHLCVHEIKVSLTDVQLCAVCQHEGGWSAQGNKGMKGISSVLHAADLISANVQNGKAFQKT